MSPDDARRLLLLLSPRQMDVVRRMAEGETAKQAGRYLGISDKTVAAHLCAVSDKIGVRNKVKLARLVWLAAENP